MGPSDATLPPDWTVRVVERTGSTNADLLAAAAAGAPDRSVLVARHQTAGRGRLDRRWEAPPGASLLMSVLCRDAAEPQAHVQRMALAVREVAAAHGAAAVLKWPNDVMVGDAKLAGILAEARDGAVVVGVGLNIAWAPPGAARLAGDDGDALDVLAIGAEVLAAIDRQPASGDALAAEYRRYLATLGRRVRVELPAPGGTTVLEGRAIDVDAAGRLVVLDECAVSHRVAAGDVVHVRGTLDPC